jgi:serine/threonine protein kinase
MSYDFTFPDKKTIRNGSLKHYTKRGKKGKYIYYEDIDILSPATNMISIDNVDYCFTYLSLENSNNKGGNSIILKLYESQYLNMDNIEYGEPDLILKILKYPYRQNRISKSALRFFKETEALKRCKDESFQNIIYTHHSGVCKCFNPESSKDETYLFYTMEYAKYDLKTFIEEKHEFLGHEEKIALCISLAEGLKELDSLGYYHRDIKPDNIFMTEKDEWKIGDLGLIDERQSNRIDDIAEPIGPRGWMSPESMNKYLCENKNFLYKHDCNIDHQSDIFQLGKVFWYIFQHNAPIGTVKEDDFLIRDSSIYSIIKTMLNHSKKKRFHRIDDIIKLLKPLEAKLLKVGS